MKKKPSIEKKDNFENMNPHFCIIDLINIRILHT